MNANKRIDTDIPASMLHLNVDHGAYVGKINFLPRPLDRTNRDYQNGLRPRIPRCYRRSKSRFRGRRCPNRRLSGFKGREDSRQRSQHASAERECNATCRPFLDSRLGASSDGFSSIKGRNLDLGKHWPASRVSLQRCYHVHLFIAV